LHHPYEEMGVDFWWLDWQQGELSGLPGLDPLWWLNHLHFYDLARHGDRRSFIFSRWGGLGNHRYPIGFSGDTVVDWASLAFQPYFTATAANVGYGWWSHDIGGHMFGQEDRELYTRWVQFGVFSPIMRLHSTNNRYHERRPWGYDAEVLRITRDAMQLRHALIPYLYTLSWENATAARSPIRPM
ncbi:MAG: alpha-xylosidase, partial [Anaerolineae bacterium]|nr:alpha-xylosidase [Anaerolineae bacterium]